MKICKNCGINHNGSYASGAFCCKTCARSYSGKTNKDKTKESKCIICNKTIQISVNCSHNFAKCEQCKIEEHLCSYGCGNIARYKTKTGYCCESHFSRCPKIKEKNRAGIKLAYENGKRKWHFTSKHREKSKQVIRDNIKERGICTSRKILIDVFEVEYKCSVCNITEWNNKEITLEVDHIDGNNQNNKIENLRLLCPNCHSQTNTFRGYNIKNNGKKKVSDDDLIDAINSSISIRQALIKINLTAKGGNYDRVKRLILQGKAKLIEN